MDLVSYLVYFVLSDRVMHLKTAMFFNFFAWAIFGVFLAGLITEVADKSRLRLAWLWGVAVALAPPLMLPIFIVVRKWALGWGGNVIFDHRSAAMRRYGYWAALIVLMLFGFLQYLLTPWVIVEVAPAVKPVVRFFL